MKKIIAVVLTLSLVLTACSAFAVELLNMATGGTTGTYYALGGHICTLLTNMIDNIDVGASVGNGSASNIRELDSGDADLAFSQLDVAVYAWNGIESFDGEQTQSFGIIGVLYPEAVQAAFCDDTGIETIADFAGRRISIGAAGSGVYQSVMDFLSYSNMTMDDIQPQYLSFSESSDALKNGTIDAAFITAGLPNPAIQDLATARNIELLSLDDATIAALCADKPYAPYTIAAGTYDGQEKDAKTVAINSVLLASAEMDEELVYQITKVLYENASEINHVAASFIKLDNALSGVPAEMIHPGALRYYTEMGIL